MIEYISHRCSSACIQCSERWMNNTNQFAIEWELEIHFMSAVYEMHICARMNYKNKSKNSNSSNFYEKYARFFIMALGGRILCVIEY